MSSHSNVFQMLVLCFLLNVKLLFRFQRLESLEHLSGRPSTTLLSMRGSFLEVGRLPTLSMSPSFWYVSVISDSSIHVQPCSIIFPEKNTADKADGACGFKTCNSSALNKSFLTPTWSPKAIWNSVSHSRWNLLCDMCGSGSKGHLVSASDSRIDSTGLSIIYLQQSCGKRFCPWWHFHRLKHADPCWKWLIWGVGLAALCLGGQGPIWTEWKEGAKRKINPPNICLWYDMANNTQMKRKEPCTSKCQRFKDMERYRN